MRPRLIETVFGLFLAWSCWLPQAVNAAPGDILNRTSQSVVKIETGTTSASGFIWTDSALVVTALHVVDGQRQITAHYVNKNGQITASSSARVERVLKASDLVLLRLDNPQSRPALEINTSPPLAKQVLDAIGFPLNIAGVSNTEVKVRFGGNQLRSILPPKVLDTINEYPSKTAEILNLEGNLVPGLSGAPIIDGNGKVVGIVDGGLESGAIGISWGIPVKHLRDLSLSNVTQLPGAAGIAELFSADLQAKVEPTRQVGNNYFTKVRSRTFQQLAATADDQLGLSQLANLFAGFNPYSFRYDIYQDSASGATVVVPEGAILTRDNYFSLASVGDPRMRMKFQILPVLNAFEAQQKALAFEQLLTNPDNMAQVGPDPQWSYVIPINRFGVTVNRKALYRNIFNGYTLQPDKYFFETLATNGNTLLAVAAVNEDSSPQILEAETACAQGWAQFDCSAIIQSRRVWAQMVLGVQFASFPQIHMQ